MKKIILAVLLACVLGACSNPKDIVFGPDPLKTLSDQSEEFKKLPEEDRTLLVGYLGVNAIGKAFNGGKETNPIAGRTVGEVLVDAHMWKDRIAAEEIARKQKDAEAQKLRDQVIAQRKEMADKIGAAVTVAVVSKHVLPEDYQVQRLYPMLLVHYAIQNKTDKTIQQLKGTVYYTDPTGEALGSLHVTFNEPVGPQKSIQTDTGRGWEVRGYGSKDIEQIAHTPFDGMKTRFEADAIAYTDGEVLKAPDLETRD